MEFISKELGEEYITKNTIIGTYKCNGDIRTVELISKDNNYMIYFRIFNNKNISESTKCARITIFGAMYLRCNDSLEEWFLNEEEKIAFIKYTYGRWKIINDIYNSFMNISEVLMYPNFYLLKKIDCGKNNIYHVYENRMRNMSIELKESYRYSIDTLLTNEQTIQIMINPNDPYLLLFDNNVFYSTKCARISILNARYIRCNDSYLPEWILSKNEKDNLIKLLTSNNNWKSIIEIFNEEIEYLLDTDYRLPEDLKIPDYMNLKEVD